MVVISLRYVVHVDWSRHMALKPAADLESRVLRALEMPSMAEAFRLELMSFPISSTSSWNLRICGFMLLGVDFIIIVVVMMACVVVMK